MTGRFIHSSEPATAVSDVSVTEAACGVPGTSGVDEMSSVKSPVGIGSDVPVGGAVFIELMYLGVGIICSSVNVGVDVSVGITLDSAPQAVDRIQTIKVIMNNRFVMNYLTSDITGNNLYPLHVSIATLPIDPQTLKFAGGCRTRTGPHAGVSP